jgi:hypothetical protein
MATRALEYAGQLAGAAVALGATPPSTAAGTRPALETERAAVVQAAETAIGGAFGISDVREREKERERERERESWVVVARACVYRSLAAAHRWGRPCMVLAGGAAAVGPGAPHTAQGCGGGVGRGRRGGEAAAGAAAGLAQQGRAGSVRGAVPAAGPAQAGAAGCGGTAPKPGDPTAPAPPHAPAASPTSSGRRGGGAAAATAPASAPSAATTRRRHRRRGVTPGQAACTAAVHERGIGEAAAGSAAEAAGPRDGPGDCEHG